MFYKTSSETLMTRSMNITYYLSQGYILLSVLCEFLQSYNRKNIHICQINISGASYEANDLEEVFSLIPVMNHHCLFLSIL